MKVLKSLFLFLLNILTLLRPMKWKLHNPLGAEVCSFTLYTSSSSRQNICSCEKSTFFLFLTYKRGEGKTFDELLKDYSNDKRLVMTQLSVQTQENWGQLNQVIIIVKEVTLFRFTFLVFFFVKCL